MDANSRPASTTSKDVIAPNASNSHPATPLQAGMLFHAIANPGTGVDIEQISIAVDETFELDHFKAAWQVVFERYEIMRASFIWEDRPEPTLAVRPSIDPTFTLEDWTSVDAEDIEAKIASTMDADRVTDFGLSSEPLHRFVVAKIADNRWWILWSFHHSILDGRSFPIVLTDVFTLYDRGLDYDLGVTTQFSAYARAIENQPLDAARSYWSDKLRSFETASSIWSWGTNAVGPNTPAVDYIETQLNREKTDQLRALAVRNDVSLNTCVQTAWYLLLQHYSQQETVTFGTTRACRHVVDGAADMVGLLINTVPMSINVVEGETLEDLLARLWQEQRDLRSFETTPIPTIRESGGIGANDLFESIVVFDDASLNHRMAGHFPDHANTRTFRYDGQTNFPLTLLAYGDPSMTIRLEYNKNKYDASTAQRLVDQLLNLLNAFGSNDKAEAIEAARIPLLTKAESEQFQLWNQTDKNYHLDTTLQELFEAQVERSPDATALQFRDSSLSYQEFNERANQLAHYLRAKGVGPDTGVGVFTERSLEMMIAVYGIIKAGGGYVPFDPEHPEDRVRFMAADSGVSIVLTQGHLLPVMPKGDYEILVVDEPGLAWADEPTHNPEPISGPDNLAYLLYTSGSTGRPKGVMIEHRAIVNRLIWMQETYQLTGSDCVLQKTPYTFDVSVWELFWPMQVGARLVMADPGGHRDTGYLTETIEKFEVTTLHFVPSMLQLFVEDPTISRCSSVKRIICSGEALPRTLQDRLFEVLPTTELHNLYGPTEAAIDVTWWACDPESALDTVPIGYPIANTQVHILDPRLQQIPVGVQGELHIGGVQVARGYHNREELTAEKFIPDPYNLGGNLYKTGDLVRYRPDGAVEFLGRIDHQIKIRGQRIELGEIEAVIGDFPAVREVVVVAIGTSAADTQLVGYIVGDNIDETALIKHCSVSLASYMVPTIWMDLDEFPLSPNGKIDRKELPKPQLDTNREIVKPANTEESDVTDVWRKLLGHDTVGVTDAFFDVGGNSLLLVQLSLMLTEKFSKNITVPMLLRHTTVRQQADLIVGNDEQIDEAAEAGARQADARRASRSKRRRRVGA